MSAPAPPLPRPTADTQPFWDGVARGELLLQRCARCRRFWLPPSPLCPHCWSREWTRERASGRGAVHSFVVYRRSYHPAYRDALPYVVAIVELEEGPRMTTRLAGVDHASVRLGMPVLLSITRVGDTPLPFFTARSIAAARR